MQNWRGNWSCRHGCAWRLCGLECRLVLPPVVATPRQTGCWRGPHSHACNCSPVLELGNTSAGDEAHERVFFQHCSSAARRCCQRRHGFGCCPFALGACSVYVARVRQLCVVAASACMSRPFRSGAGCVSLVAACVVRELLQRAPLDVVCCRAHGKRNCPVCSAGVAFVFELSVK